MMIMRSQNAPETLIDIQSIVSSNETSRRLHATLYRTLNTSKRSLMTENCAPNEHTPAHTHTLNRRR